MSQEEDIDELAAEYVLGSLSPEERAAARDRYANDARFSKAIADWERRLMPLSHREPGMEPPPRVLERVLTEIAQEQVAQTEPSQNVVAMRGRVQRWQWAAGSLAAAAAVLAIVLGSVLLRPQSLQPDVTIAVLAGGANTTADEPVASTDPVFLARFKARSGQLGVRQIGGRRPSAPRVYTLWITQGESASAKAVGQILAGDVETMFDLSARSPAGLSAARFLVSLEIEGQSLTDGPKGPIVSSGRLVRHAP